MDGNDPNLDGPHLTDHQTTMIRHSHSPLRGPAWPVFGWLAGLAALLLVTATSRAQSSNTNGAAILVATEGTVEILPAGQNKWVPAKSGQAVQVGDQLRTGPRSRATLKLSDLSVLRVSENMGCQIQPPRTSSGKAVLDLKAGAAYFFSRDRPQEIQLDTPVLTGAIRGTEFNVDVGPDGRTELSLINGEVAVATAWGNLVLTNGEQVIAESGHAPVKTALLNANNVIQWVLYYPAVIDAAELGFTPEEEHFLGESLAAYRAGNLPEALRKYPVGRVPVSAAERIYRSQLLLAVGLVEQAEAGLPLNSGLDHASRLADAIRQLVATVKFDSWDRRQAPELASEWVAESYYLQSHSKLPEALTAAQNAVRVSPDFAFGWERVADLQFSFGRTAAALVALDNSLRLAPRNAQAISLKGFLLSAQNRTRDAIGCFDEAIALDGALANAWLGRGLCRIRKGEETSGRADLLIAASLEPQRSILRSYLGKAFGDAGEDKLANKELNLARQLDPNDPTSWLYSALLKQQENRINEAIDDLQNSQERNDNLSLFRSTLLLDEDRAVRSANMASVYRDAGMNEVSVREAAQAVTYDYGNSSAHLFLSDAYNDLRDPTQFNLRYETVWFNELLLANLLAPVGAGRLSQTVSQQDYSKLFQKDGLGLANVTDLRSDGMFHQQASQFGTFGDTTYALDLNYHHNDGIYVNNGLDDLEWDTTIKQQFTPTDTGLLLVQYQNYHSGDNFQYYNVTNARPFFKFDEYQHPIVVGGWDHEWSPGMRTLALVGRLTDQQFFSDKAAPQLVLDQFPNGTVYGAQSVPYDIHYNNQFDIYSGEVNHICEWERVTLSLGARYQSGTFQAEDQLFNASPAVLFTPTTNSIDGHFQRITGYGYLTIEPLDRLWLTGGFADDNVTFPDNYRQPPVNSGEDERSQLGPKAALVWSPVPQAALRGVYSRSLGGVSLDESYRLEPTELAGFPQAFRSLISETIVGSVAAPAYETAGVALDLKFGSRTFAGIQAERLTTDIHRDIGVFELQNGVSPGHTPETLDYKEYNLTASVNQLVGDQTVVGTSYTITRSELHDVLNAIPVSVLSVANQQEDATLQQVACYVQLNHRSGFFARAEAAWYGQSNSGWTPAEPGDDFFQYNLFSGYYFWQRRAKLGFNILNLTGQNYKLNSLTPYQYLPRSRVFEGVINFTF